MAYFEFEKKKIFYKVFGQGEPLLLLHGNTLSSKMFTPLVKKYSKGFQVIALDFPGHGKSDRLEKFDTNFWFYNSKAAYALINELQLEQISVVGTSGGALAAINLGLEHPEKIKFLVADSFMGEYPLQSFAKTIKSDRERDKKKFLVKLIWLFCHGFDWEKVVDLDTQMNIEFSKTGSSFFQKTIDELIVPTLITGSKQDEYCNDLDKIYGDLKKRNEKLEVFLFEKGNHPAMLSNKSAFFEIVKDRIKNTDNSLKEETPCNIGA